MEKPIGEVIAHLRKEKKYSQEALAKRLGISHAYMCMIETGYKSASIRLLKTICDEVDVTMSELISKSLGGEVSPDSVEKVLCVLNYDSDTRIKW